MKIQLKWLALVGAMVVTTACAGPQFPESGTSTKFDGMWEAKLPGTREACSKASTKFEIRYGHAIGAVYEKGKKIADIWGELDADGNLKGDIGKLGISGAHAKVKFTEKSGTGTWQSKDCHGTVEAKRVG